MTRSVAVPAARTAFEDVDKVKGFLAQVRDLFDAVKEQASAVNAAKREAAGEVVPPSNALTGPTAPPANSA